MLGSSHIILYAWVDQRTFPCPVCCIKLAICCLSNTKLSLTPVVPVIVVSDSGSESA